MDRAGPKPMDWAGLKPIDRAGPKPMDWAGPKHMDGAGPKPMDWAGPKPMDRAGPKPMDWAGPKPMDLAGSKPMNGAGSKPMDGAGSKPMDGAGPKPMNGAGSKPMNRKGSKPMNRTGSKPMDRAGPKPMDGAGPKPMDGAGSKPMDRAGSKPMDGTGSKPMDGAGSKPMDRAGPKPMDGAGSKPMDGAGSKPMDGTGSNPVDTSCVVSLETSAPPTLTSTFPTPPAKEQVPAVPRKRSRVDAAAPQPLEFLRTPFGGRILVHKAFLYKQEKAVGDKVYWKCRRHAELGCRGRAVTRGLRATVMRDHCHPPDEEDLEEAGCQKEELPEGLGELPSPEGSEGQEEEVLDGVTLWPLLEEPDPILKQLALEEEEKALSLSLLRLPLKKRKRRPGQGRCLEFLRTCYGGHFLVYRSFLYKREKVVGDKVYWTCRDHALYGCRSRAITQGQRVTMMRRHCHPPDMKGLEARRQQEKAMEEDTPDVFEFCGSSLTPSVDSLFSHRDLGTLPATKPQSRKRAKAKDQELPAQPEAPQGSPEEDQGEDPGGPEFLKTPLGGSFLVHESFLYRREKAAGDKVYWTCRDQARMGCRSRAITQGRQVTVMRGHCHPPDVLGLEMLRQREKHPSPTQWGVPEGPEFLKTPLGGSFLVHESFLYRREKAAGDKVYWTCRDQARMGCRSRAITQGQRVMVMRRHCHPPDMGGLEALRQREHFPNLSQWEGPEPLQPLEFLRTSLGGKFLVHESFLYRKEKAAGEKVYWMCRDQARLGCRSRAITQGRRVMVMRGHCHPPDLPGLEALRKREQRPGTAQQ
ncbi:FLYWCH-type zinc finger-containing protein 1 isoform X3 [Perognathus longimembris pacificus]|uniref:FLYWCH-type zinc finger-containing protein 1 isoform X3 n=1 Tax=Perognathus longimembris pacificus TaxID=214514 RepID=UPI002019F03D|nr:FLYWCH-type zinc finger-containing protein 1 isoform X3 [Perognathus longimembris pacificus]